jgi:hypothetical protein
MKLISFLTLLLLSTVTLAELTVRVSPESPVKEESFNVVFEIVTDSDDEPMVSFDPVGVEVLGRSKEVSLSTSIINGRFSSTRKIRMIYEMVSESARTARIRDIKVELGNKTLTHEPVRINILTRKKTPRNIFLQAEISKENVYLGEGIDVRYYLYSRVPVVQTEFKSFPKLNGFIKRFHKVNDKEEAVEYEGAVYRKSLKYSARIYPEKVGKLYIDPLRLNIQYAGSSGNPFGSFGMAFNRFRSKGVSSKKVEIQVLPLPSENVPPHFTGLVGEHEFRLISNKQKYVVNEAIEAKMEVIGPGALEKMEAPILYKNDALEQFDTKSEFFEVGLSSGRKVFDYTYLARADVNLAQKELKLAYFDPNDGTYKEKLVIVPELQIGGGASALPAQGTVGTEEIAAVESQETTQKAAPTTKSVAPLFESSYRGIPISWPRLALMGLFLVLLIQLMELIIKNLKKNRADENLDKEILELKKNGLTYNRLLKLVYHLRKEGVESSARKLIESSGLSKKDKDYFLEMLDLLGQKDFATTSKNKKRPIFKMAAFKALKKEIENERLQVTH